MPETLCFLCSEPVKVTRVPHRNLLRHATFLGWFWQVKKACSAACDGAEDACAGVAVERVGGSEAGGGAVPGGDPAAAGAGLRRGVRRHSPRLPQAAAILMLNALGAVAEHARSIDADLQLRRDLAAAQAEGKVGCCPDSRWTTAQKVHSPCAHIR